MQSICWSKVIPLQRCRCPGARCCSSDLARGPEETMPWCKLSPESEANECLLRQDSTCCQINTGASSQRWERPSAPRSPDRNIEPLNQNPDVPGRCRWCWFWIQMYHMKIKYEGQYVYNPHCSVFEQGLVNQLITLSSHVFFIFWPSPPTVFHFTCISFTIYKHSLDSHRLEGPSGKSF